MLGISCDRLQIREVFIFFEARAVQIGMGSVAHAFIIVQIQIIYAPVIGGQRGNHPVLFFTLILFC